MTENEVKIAFASDLHLEYGALGNISNTGGAEILILAGDIMQISEIHKTDNFTKFIENVASEFPIVLYVLGNHEHYNGDILNTVSIIRREVIHLPNVIILDNDHFEFENFVFIGGTLWTNCENRNQEAIKIVDRMHDYRKINYNGKPLTVNNTLDEHEKTISAIGAPHTKAKIVVTHHAPSRKSIDTLYVGDPLNAAYVSNLESLMHDVKLWIHGHIHEEKDYYIGSTRVISNPRGYVGFEIPEDFQFRLKYLTISV